MKSFGNTIKAITWATAGEATSTFCTAIGILVAAGITIGILDVLFRGAIFVIQKLFNL